MYDFAENLQEPARLRHDRNVEAAGIFISPGAPMRLDYTRKKYAGESAGEYRIAPRSAESRPQGSTRAARQPSVRPQTPWSRTELDRKHNHLDPTEPN